MNRSPLRRFPSRKRPNFVSKKRRDGTPGGNWEFTHAGKTYSLMGRFLQDTESPSDDGLRWINSWESNRFIVDLVYELAQGRCQLRESPSCWDWIPRQCAQTHHVRHKKMGGAFTDDRIWITIDGEKVQIRILACHACHRHHHNNLHFGETIA